MSARVVLISARVLLIITRVALISTRVTHGSTRVPLISTRVALLSPRAPLLSPRGNFQVHVACVSVATGLRVWLPICSQLQSYGWTLVAPNVGRRGGRLSPPPWLGRWIRGPNCRTASWTRWVPRMISRWRWQMRPTRPQRAQTQARRKSKTAWRM